jgi:enoyl-CoA hydratase/carnithine racemase
MSDIEVRSHAAVLEVCFHRASKHNALTEAMYSVSAHALLRLEQDDEIKALVFTADGPSFCAGNDIGEFLGHYSLATGSPWRTFLDRLAEARKPVLAAVHGKAIGIGFTMLLHCDLVYVEPDVLLSGPFVQLGLVPEAASSQLLPMLVGYQRACAMLLLGRAMDAEEAQQVGLATAVVPKGSSREAALSAARTLVGLPHESLLQTKRLMRLPIQGAQARIAAECAVFMSRLGDPTTRTILSRFAKRSPHG